MMQRLHDPRASRAVLISNFPCDSPHAERVDEQLDRLRDLLTDEVRWGLDREHCIRVPEPSTANHMYLALKTASEATAEGGLLVVYYAGHLTVTPEYGLYMTMPDTDPDDLDNTAFAMASLRWYVRYSRASRRLFILDCCHDGIPQPDPVATLAKIAAIDKKTSLLIAEPSDHRAPRPAAHGIPRPAGHRAPRPVGPGSHALSGDLGRLLREGLPDGPVFLDVRTLLDHVGEGHRLEHIDEPVVLARNVAVYGPDRTGQILCAAPSIDDPDLAESVVMILRYDRNEGALGVVINRPARTHGVPSDWAGFLDEPVVIFDGGPIRHEGFIPLFALRRNAPPPVRFRTVKEHLGTMPLWVEPAAVASVVEHVRLFSGYVGWGPGELEDDLARSRFVPVDAGIDDIFTGDPNGLWPIYQRMITGGRETGVGADRR